MFLLLACCRLFDSNEDPVESEDDKPGNVSPQPASQSYAATVAIPSTPPSSTTLMGTVFPICVCVQNCAPHHLPLHVFVWCFNMASMVVMQLIIPSTANKHNCNHINYNRHTWDPNLSHFESGNMSPIAHIWQMWRKSASKCFKFHHFSISLCEQHDMVRKTLQ